MLNDTIHLALFKEEEIDSVAEALDRLRELGIAERDMSVISGVPFSDKILGRPMAWTRVGQIGLAGAALGFLIALALNFGTPYLYPIRVGGQPIFPIPTSIVVTFELTMLGLMLAIFLGVFLEMISPTYGPRGYDARISHGSIGVLFKCPVELERRMHEMMDALGADVIHRPEEEI